MAERSIYAYDPRLPPEREVRQLIERKIAGQRGTCAQTRYAQTWILTCKCGALAVTSSMTAPGKFLKDHAACREAA